MDVEKLSPADRAKYDALQAALQVGLDDMDAGRSMSYEEFKRCRDERRRKNGTLKHFQR